MPDRVGHNGRVIHKNGLIYGWVRPIGQVIHKNGLIYGRLGRRSAALGMSPDFCISPAILPGTFQGGRYIWLVINHLHIVAWKVPAKIKAPAKPRFGSH